MRAQPVRKKDVSQVKNSVAAVRERRALSVATLAKSVGVSRQTIYSIEAGTYVPNTAVSLRLARELGVSLEDLFQLSESPGMPDHSSSERATALPSAQNLQPGQPVQLCRVGNQLFAAGPSSESCYLPDSDAVVQTQPASRQKLDVRVYQRGKDLGNRLLVAGCDPAMTILARHLRPAGVELVLVHQNSSQSLQLLKDGHAHIAGTHLRDPSTGEANLPAINRLFAKGSVVAVSFAIWEEGLVTATGNPKHIRDVADLTRRNVSFINREQGAATRILLDTLLRNRDSLNCPQFSARNRDARNRDSLNCPQFLSKARSIPIRGYERLAPSHLAAAREVHRGTADCALSTQAAARHFGLDFVPLATARYDLVIRKQDFGIPAVQTLLNTITQSDFRRELSVACQYDTTVTGTQVL